VISPVELRRGFVAGEVVRPLRDYFTLWSMTQGYSHLTRFGVRGVGGIEDGFGIELNFQK
jgi:hypothetical protein